MPCRPASTRLSMLLALAPLVLPLAAGTARAQGTVPQSSPVPAQSPVASDAVSSAPGSNTTPPDRIAAPATAAAGPGLGGGAAGAPLAGALTQQPAAARPKP